MRSDVWCVDNTFANNTIADFQAGHAFANLDDFADPFMARRNRVRNRDDVVAGQQFVI